MFTEKNELSINIDPNNRTISIQLWEVVYKNEEKFAEKKGPRRAFLPGEINEVNTWIEDCSDKDIALSICRTLWGLDE